MNGRALRKQLERFPDRYIRPMAHDLSSRLPTPVMRAPELTPARFLGGGLSAIAGIGALAFGALAIGAMAINRLAVKRARIESLSVGMLEVDRLVIRDRVDPEEAAEARMAPRRRQGAKARA